MSLWASSGTANTAAQIAVTPASGVSSTNVQAALEELQTELASAGAVASVHGRTGAVTSVSGDYNAGQVAVSPVGDLVATNVQAALEELQTELTALDLTTIQTHTQTVGDGTATVFAISHGFGSYDVLVNIRTSVAPFTKLEESAYDVVYTDTDNLQLTFTTAPTAGQYEVFCATFTAGGEVGGAPLPGTQIYDAAGVYSFVVPGSVTEMTAKVWGAGGGGPAAGGAKGGGGGYVEAVLAVTPGEVLTIRNGGGGVKGTSGSVVSGGGGITGVFRGADLMSSTPLAIGGSGGGAGYGATQTFNANGGAGGGSAGQAGTGSSTPYTGGGGGGTQVGGGTAGGAATGGGYLAAGTGTAASGYHGSAGGLGYFGGGGASSTSATPRGSGGGSGYTPTSGSPLLAAGAPTPTNTAGSDHTPANTGDPDYGLSNAGLGGNPGANGNPGRIVLNWV